MALLDEYPPALSLGNRALEPAAGTGEMVRVLQRWGLDVVGIEIQQDMHGYLSPICNHVIGDWLKISHLWKDGPIKIIITNPPFNLGLEYARACLSTEADYVALLLPTAFLHSSRRFEFNWHNRPSALLTFAERIQYDQRGSPPRDHSWFIWTKPYGRFTEIRPIKPRRV